MIPVALRRRGATALSLMLLVSALQVAPVSAGEPPLPGTCPTLKALSEVNVGDTGNGWTVERGTERERFRFEVLGIIADGIAPGRDMIIVEVSDVLGNDMIARSRGIWAGMSGSPVYLGDELLGAVAYGFTFGPSTIGGVTPAVDMADVLDYGAPAAGVAAGAHRCADVTARRSRRASRRVGRGGRVIRAIAGAVLGLRTQCTRPRPVAGRAGAAGTIRDRRSIRACPTRQRRRDHGHARSRWKLRRGRLLRGRHPGRRRNDDLCMRRQGARIRPPAHLPWCSCIRCQQRQRGDCRE